MLSAVREPPKVKNETALANVHIARKNMPSGAGALKRWI